MSHHHRAERRMEISGGPGKKVRKRSWHLFRANSQCGKMKWVPEVGGGDDDKTE